MSGVRIDGGVRFWGFRRDAMATKDFLDLADSRGIGRRNEVPVSCKEVLGFRSCVFLPDT